jgi:hypothetical protein
MLQSDWSGHTLLDVVCRTRFAWDRGFLMIDDTVLPKPFATAIESLAWVYASQERKPVYGLSLVLRVPLGIRLWHKGGPSKYALALELLSDARNRLGCRPADVLFDAWYPSRALPKRIHDYGWYFVCRLKKNRRFNGHAVRAYRRPPYWAATGQVTGGLNVLVVRYGAKSYATNRLTLAAAEVRRLYRVRAQIEEVIRVCKDQLSLSGCQARSERAQLPHLACCLAAFCVLERERHDRGLSIYKLRRALSWNGQSINLPTLERLKHVA